MSLLLQKLIRQRIDLEKRIKELEVSKVRHRQILIRLDTLSKSGSFNTIVKRVNELESIIREMRLDALKESRVIETLVKKVNKLEIDINLLKTIIREGLDDPKKGRAFDTATPRLVKKVNEREIDINLLKTTATALEKRVNKLDSFETTHWQSITDQRERITELESITQRLLGEQT